MEGGGGVVERRRARGARVVAGLLVPREIHTHRAESFEFPYKSSQIRHPMLRKMESIAEERGLWKAGVE